MRENSNSHKAKQKKVDSFNWLPQPVRAPFILLIVGLETVSESFQSFYKLAVRRMFWGRSSWYKLTVHLGIGGLTLIVLLGGISTKFVTARIAAAGSEVYTNLDNAAAQGRNLQAAESLSTLATFSIKTHQVQPGDSLESLAQTYAVNKNTIKWSNSRLISPYNDNLPQGAQLLIPDVDGVLYEIRNGDNFDKVINTTGGDKKTVIDVNGLNENNLAVEVGQYVFVPGGKLPPPPPLGKSKPAPGGYTGPRTAAVTALAGFPLGFFDSPVTHPQCLGWNFNRGINLNKRSSGYHTGIDIAKYLGCPIRAVGAGRVKHAGILDSRAAWTVIIDHGNGVESHYYHGLPGAIWVKVGERVEKGQDIMYMGNSGNSRATHLHLTLKYNGVLIDPQLYIPL